MTNPHMNAAADAVPGREWIEKPFFTITIIGICAWVAIMNLAPTWQTKTADQVLSEQMQLMACFARGGDLLDVGTHGFVCQEPQ